MLIDELIMQLEDGSLNQASESYANDSVFVNKVHEFEDAYKMKWYEFMLAFDEHRLVPKNDQERLDYAEWHILCRKFEDKLEEGLTIMASPPLDTTDEYEAVGGPGIRASSLCYTRRSHGVPSYRKAQAKNSGKSAHLFSGSREIRSLLSSH